MMKIEDLTKSITEIMDMVVEQNELIEKQTRLLELVNDHARGCPVSRGWSVGCCTCYYDKIIKGLAKNTH